MRKNLKSVDKILPYGEAIRGFLNQSFLTETDIKVFLKNRGVFLYDYSKGNSVPFITSTLLSPGEFDSLKESQGTREDNPKRTNEIFEWHGEQTLKDAITENKSQILSSLIPNNCNFRLLNNPIIHFDPDKNNEAKIIFEIERDDLNKSWYESRSSFKAEVYLNLNTTKKQLQLTKTYTSDETKQVLTLLSKNLKNSFSEKGYLDNSQKSQSIIFKDFSNQNRFYFLFNLATNLHNNVLAVEHKDISDIEFKPDPNINLPDDLKWMNDKSKVILKGKSIQKTDFLTKVDNYQLLILWSVEALYRFDIGGIQGTLTLQIGFPDYSRNNYEDAELTIVPNKCYIFDRSHAMKKNEVTKRLLDEIDKIKFDIYDQFKS
ncbi:hypothetical protein DYU05_07305 [Mucilaginibacter terrenus]|uniref:GAPS4b N-terminal domain-containing protein n=1 Tax=Mucilaginibacter terrenus TaxID=2482727 RepID=A0A3E2NWJ1_9SPHI|nr:hypothetical protein [Mucilaginibacter terrenus]RFZ85396.1 hypothetical protein DYU05_07305 [Mucilaginibacter terrenus]